jgi:hypothetical protein
MPNATVSGAWTWNPTAATGLLAGVTVVTKYATQFGTLEDYEKGTLEIIDDDPKRYTYSNMFEVAEISKPWEKVAVAKNMEYVLEVLRAEGTSPWRICTHDEFAIVMDGEVEFRFVKPDEASIVPPEDKEGSVSLDDEPAGAAMGTVRARKGHMTLLPAGAAYQMRAEQPGVVLMQAIAGDDTVYKWAEICQTAP